MGLLPSSRVPKQFRVLEASRRARSLQSPGGCSLHGGVGAGWGSQSPGCALAKGSCLSDPGVNHDPLKASDLLPSSLSALAQAEPL